MVCKIETKIETKELTFPDISNQNKLIINVYSADGIHFYEERKNLPARSLQKKKACKTVCLSFFSKDKA